MSIKNLGEEPVKKYIFEWTWYSDVQFFIRLPRDSKPIKRMDLVYDQSKMIYKPKLTCMWQSKLTLKILSQVSMQYYNNHL